MEQDSIRETKEVSECPESLLSELMVSLYNTVNPGPVWYTTVLVCMDHISFSPGTSWKRRMLVLICINKE